MHGWMDTVKGAQRRLERERDDDDDDDAMADDRASSVPRRARCPSEKRGGIYICDVFFHGFWFVI
jgi:hypothetical protein